MVDSLVKIALEKLPAILQDEAVLLVCVKKDLQRISNTFKQIREVLKDAEDRRIRSGAVQEWLDQLKDVAYDIDDILDEWTTEDLKSKATEGEGSFFDKMVSCLLSPITCFNHVLFHHNIGNRLKDAQERLDDIAKNACSLRLKADNGEIRREENEFRMLEIRERETSSLVDESSIFGRDDDIKKIVGQLSSESSQAANKKPIIVSIVGQGGLGKTTLAQLAYNNEKLKEHFDVNLWACVSEDFDVQRVTESLLKSASKDSEGNRSSNLNDLQNKLYEAVREKRFLLVLDDIWDKNTEKWDKLIVPFKKGAPGSQIIITTRDEGVALMMGSTDTHIHRLKVLSDDHCWSLFESRAFKNWSKEEHRELQEIGRKIVEKCKGVPLALKTLGSAMCLKKTKLEWESILESETWNSKEVLGGILPALLLSYHHLPSPMKQCFAYCSLFPKDWEIEKDMLVKLWMAQGFIISSGNGDTELIGQWYFDDLVRRSLLQEEEKDDDGNIVRCKMHDLIHDLAGYVAKGEYSIVENERPSLDLTKARHFSWLPSSEVTSILDALHKFKKLRTFLLFAGSSVFMVPPNFFHQLICLRTLDLSCSDIKILPPAIKNLKHLRYLDLSHTKIEELPETVGGLCNLQTLKLKWCQSLCKLPKTIKNLKDLRYLDLSCTKIEELSETVASLCNLQTLKLEQCKSLCELPEAIENLKQLRYLDLSNTNIEELPETVGGLCNLQTLKLKRCKSLCKLPKTIKNLKDLRYLDLSGTKIEELLETVASLCNLQTLKLEQCKSLCKLPEAIENLKQLRYLDLSFTKIEELPETVGGLCNLQTLKLYRCDSLCKLPETIKNLKHLRFLDLSHTKIEELPETVTGLCNLETLKLEWCGSLCKLPQGVSQMINLKHLEIMASGLEYLPRGIGKLRQLQTLGLFVVNGREGCGLRELKHLNLLQGWLTIKGLEKASRSDEAVEAELDKKQGLRRLDLRWTTDEVDEVNVTRTDSILQALRPSHAHLEVLAIWNFPGSQLPDWMEDPQFESLTTVFLGGCWKCKQLPGLGKLPFLKECRIWGMEEVIHMDSEFCGGNAGGNGDSVSFPMLEELEFEDMPNWVGWELTSGIPLMPSLQELSISECPKLNKFLPNTLLPNLKELLLDGDINRLLLEGLLPTLPNLISLEIRDNKELTSIAGGWFGQLKALKCLKIDRCLALESLPKGLQQLTMLRTLDIIYCPALISLPKELQQLTMLHTLRINSCPALISLPEELQIRSLKLRSVDVGRMVLQGPLPNLIKLTIATEDNLISFPSCWLGQLKSLHTLCISHCPALESLPEELQSLRLQTLKIRWCPQLRDRCKEGGEDWHKISHIPTVEIDYIYVRQ